MSFLSIIKRIGVGLLQLEHDVAPILELVPPIAGPVAVIDGVVQKVMTEIHIAETAYPDGNGDKKLDMVMQGLQAGLSIAQDLLKMDGKQISYDQDKFKQAVTAQVAAFQSMADWRSTFKVVPLDKPG